MMRRRYSRGYGGWVCGMGILLLSFSPTPSTKEGQLQNIVGATGDHCSKSLFARESLALQIACAPGDPVPAYQEAELVVVPTLEDGIPFVTGEAMASALPVVVSS